MSMDEEAEAEADKPQGWCWKRCEYDICSGFSS